MSQPDDQRREQNRYLRWPVPLALIWLLAPVAGILIRLSLEPIGPHDYWWSLAMGKLIALTGEIPSQNLFLYTLEADAPFVDQPWLGQWAMYMLYDAFGHAGPMVLRNLLAAVAWAGIVAAGLRRCDDPRVVGGLALLTAAVSGPVFGVRTQMFAFLPYVALVAIIFAVADQRMRRPWLLLLAPLTALWANLHGTFMLVPVLCGLAGGALVVERWLEEREIEVAQIGWWAAAVVTTAFAAMLNPLGPGIYAYVFELTFFSNVAETVTEWQPPSIDTALGAIVMITLTASLVVMAIRRRTVRLYEAVLFAATAYLAVGAVRQMFWWGAVMLLVVPRHLVALIDAEPWWRTRTSGPQGTVHAIAAAVLILAGLLSQPGLPVYELGYQFTEGFARRTEPGRAILTAGTPTRAVEYLREHGYRGRIFHAQAAGGLLEFELATDEVEQVAFVDQRMELIPEKVWRNYFRVSDAEEGWRKVVDHYGIDTMLLGVEEQWPMIQVLHGEPAWELVAVDEKHLLFIRSFDGAQDPAKERE